MSAEKGQSWNEYFEECFEKILDKLDHMDFNGDVLFNPPHHMGGTKMHVTAELTRKGEKFKLPPEEPEKPKELRKLTEMDWLNIMQYYKMLLDGFKGADWSKDSVREQVASVMIKKTKKFFEENYPDLMEKKKRPIFDIEDFIK
tara:strand:- start:71 stop:502 length:432 start_codon:yes stop_codon:yes gene_type:complete